jgi:hypothetical protein
MPALCKHSDRGKTLTIRNYPEDIDERFAEVARSHHREADAPRVLFDWAGHPVRAAINPAFCSKLLSHLNRSLNFHLIEFGSVAAP